MSDDAATDGDSQWQRIAAIDDELASIDRGDFSRRAALAAEREKAVQELRDTHQDAEQLASWAEHAPVADLDRSTPYIPSRSEGGGAPA